MTLKRISGPAEEPVALSEVKLFCRIDTDVEDSALEQMISAARLAFERETGLVLIHQEWEWTLDRLPDRGADGRRTLEVPLAPLSAIDELVVKDAAGAEEDIPPTDYVLDAASSLPRLVERTQGLWPSPQMAAAGVRLAFTAGFGDDGGDIPADIRHALLELVAHAYENRGLGEGGFDISNARVAALLAPYRRVRL